MKIRGITSLIGLLLLVGGSDGVAAVSEFPIEPVPSGPAIIRTAPDGSLWFAAALAKQVMQYDRSGHKLYALQLDATAFPVGVAIDRSGAIWFTDAGNNTLNRFDPTSKKHEVYKVPTDAAWPFFVVVDSHDAVWFTERAADKIGRFDPASRSFQEFALASHGAQPAGMTVTGDDHIFFTENSGHRIGHLAPRSKTIEEIPILSELKHDAYYGLAGIYAGPNGDIWFAELDGRIGRIERHAAAYGSVTEYRVPNTAGRPAGVFVDAKNCVWFTELDGNRIVRFDPGKHVFEGFAIPTGQPDPEPRVPAERTARGQKASADADAAKTTRPFGITGAPDGTIWFTEQYGQQLGVVAAPERICRPDYAALLPRPGDGAVDLRCAPGCRPEAARRQNPVRLASTDAPPAATGEAVGEEAVAPVKSFRVSYKNVVPGVVDADPQGGVWFTEIGGFPLPGIGHLPPGEKIARVDPTGHIDEYRTPTPGSAPTSLKVARNGSVWFTERLAGKIGWWNPATRAIREFSLPTERAEPIGIAIDEPRGRIWFTERGVDRIGYLTPTTGEVREYKTPSPNSEPSTIAVDWAGNVWFDERGADTVVRLDPENGTFRSFIVPTPKARVIGVTPDAARRKIWFLELAASKLGWIEPDSGQVAEISLPASDSFPFKLSLGERGEIYFTEVFGNRLGIWTGESFIQLRLPRERSLPGGIAVDTTGNVWFTEQAQGRIDMLPKEEIVQLLKREK